MPRHSRLSTLRDPQTARNARALRTMSTPAERRLWYYLRSLPAPRFHLRKQAPIGPYIVDFLYESRRLVVEVDGGSHSESEEADARRTRWLEARGYRVLRFWNHEVMGNIEGVVSLIVAALGP